MATGYELRYFSAAEPPVRVDVAQLIVASLPVVEVEKLRRFLSCMAERMHGHYHTRVRFRPKSLCPAENLCSQMLVLFSAALSSQVFNKMN